APSRSRRERAEAHTQRRLLAPRLCVQRQELPGGWSKIESELGSTFAHAFVARWNWGACWSIAEGSVIAPSRSGSGKFGTPCERMQAANFTTCASCWGLLPPAGDPLLGRRWPQVREA